jgi:hypothetical protein
MSAVEVERMREGRNSCALLLAGLPDGQIKISCPALARKIFRLTCRANQWFDSARLTREEGRVAIVTKRAV